MDEQADDLEVVEENGPEDDVQDVEAPEGDEQDCDGAGDSLEAVERPASARGWGPGWPNCQRGLMTTFTVTGGVQYTVRRELAPLVKSLCEETIERGYRLRKGECWGYVCRPVRGSSTVPSNHSWGLAVDLNSRSNPMGSRLVTDMPSWLPTLWKQHGFRWGGDYTRRKDAMHFEYMGTVSDAVNARGRQDPQPKSKGTVHWNQLKYGQRDSESVRHLQRELNATVHAGLPLTGNYLDRTKAAVAEFQRRQGWSGSDADGLIFPGGRETTRRLLGNQGYSIVW